MHGAGCVLVHHVDGHDPARFGAQRQDRNVVNRYALGSSGRPVDKGDDDVTAEIQPIDLVGVDSCGVRRHGRDRADHGVVDQHIYIKQARLREGTLIVDCDLRAAVVQSRRGQRAARPHRRGFAT